MGRIIGANGRVQDEPQFSIHRIGPDTLERCLRRFGISGDGPVAGDGELFRDAKQLEYLFRPAEFVAVHDVAVPVTCIGIMSRTRKLRQDHDEMAMCEGSGRLFMIQFKGQTAVQRSLRSSAIIGAMRNSRTHARRLA